MQGHAKVCKNNSTSRNIQTMPEIYHPCISTSHISCKPCSHHRHDIGKLQFTDIPAKFHSWSDGCVQLQYPSRKIDLTRGLVLCEEERRLDGTSQESDVWTRATWLKSPFWFKQSLANFSSELDAVVFFDCFGVVIQLLARNCLPYHQPCPITYNPRKCCSLPGMAHGSSLQRFPGGPITDH